MSSGVTRFGKVEFDDERGKLWVGGRPVKLDRSCAAILSILLGEAGKEVDKDRLLEAGWHGRVVHENSLAKAMGRLRHALGEDASALETVHGYGYRLAAEPVNAPASAQHHRAPILHLTRRLVPVAAAVGVAALPALWLGRDSNNSGSAEETKMLRGEPADAIGRVLWVDDHPENNNDERRHLEFRKIAVYQTTSSDDALKLLAMYDYGVVISDMNRNGRSLAGLKLLRAMRQRKDATPYFVYTVVPSAAQRALVAEAGGQGVAVKSAELYSAVLPLFGRDKLARTD